MPPSTQGRSYGAPPIARRGSSPDASTKFPCSSSLSHVHLDAFAITTRPQKTAVLLLRMFRLVLQALGCRYLASVSHVESERLDRNLETLLHRGVVRGEVAHQAAVLE